MSKVVMTIVGVAEIVAGALIPGAQFLIAAGIATLSSVAVSLLTPGYKQQDRQAASTTLQIGEIARQGLFGEAMTGGSLLDGFNYGGKYNTDWEVLPIAIADHRCEALSGFFVNDTYVPFTGNGPVAGYNGQLEVYWLPGTEDQVLPTVLTQYGGWSASDNCAGVAMVVACYKADAPDAKNPVWPSGRPRFGWVVKGKCCYIARKDSSVGGSGNHRWNDPSTWEWTDNPVDCRYNWARGIYACDRVDQPDQLLIGRGLSALEAPPENTFWRANLCDELVTLPGGGSEKRYTVSTQVGADEEFLTVEERFAAACAGVITQPQGAVEIEPGHAKTPVATITDDNVIVGTKVTFSDFRSEADSQWSNTIIPRYIEPGQRWADHGAPIRRIYRDVIADGGPREQTLTIATTSSFQAQRCGEIQRRLGRLWKTGGLTLGPWFAGLEEGDWIVWQSARRTKGVAVTFRVDSFALDQKWQNTLTLREITSASYDMAPADYGSDGAVAQQQTPVDPAAYLASSGGAKGISARDPLYPVTSTATSVSIAAFSGTVSGGIGVMQFPAATLPADASSVYDVFWSLSGQGYQLVAAPGLDAFANPDLVFLEQVGTADGATGDYPATETPPGGYRGSGGGYNGAQLQ